MMMAVTSSVLLFLIISTCNFASAAILKCESQTNGDSTASICYCTAFGNLTWDLPEGRWVQYTPSSFKGLRISNGEFAVELLEIGETDDGETILVSEVKFSTIGNQISCTDDYGTEGMVFPPGPTEPSTTGEEDPSTSDLAGIILTLWLACL